MFILTLRLTAAVSRAWQPGFTRCGCVCCEKESLLPFHVHCSSISLGLLAMVRSLFSSLWLSNGQLLPSCHHERWHCLHSALPFFFSTPLQLARQSQLRSLSWLIYLMYGVNQFFFFSNSLLHFSEFLSPVWAELHCLHHHEAVSGCILASFFNMQVSFKIGQAFANRTNLHYKWCCTMVLQFGTSGEWTTRSLLKSVKKNY